MKERNTTLNFLKAFGCILVVILHAGVSGVSMATAAAVDIFFITSGYFAYNETHDYKKIKSKMIHILKMLLWSMLFYFIFCLVYFTIDGNVMKTFTTIGKYFKPFDFFVLNDFDFLLATHLWFLMALVYAYFVLMITEKHNITKYFYYLIPVIALINISLNLMLVEGMVSSHYLSNALRSIMYIYIGFFIASKKDKVIKLGKKLPLILAIISLIVPTAAILAIFALGKSNLLIDLCFIGVIIVPVGCFIWALNNPTKINRKIWNTLGDKYSLYVYIIHAAVLQLCELILNKLGKDSTHPLSILIRVVMAVAISIIAGMVIIRIQDTVKAKKGVTQK